MKFLSKWFDPRISQELERQKRPIQLGLLCTGVSALLAAGVYQLIHKILTAVGERNPMEIQYVAGMVVALYVVKYWFTRGEVYFLTEAANRLTAELRVRMFRKLQSLPISYFNEKRAGAIQSVLTNDVSVYQNAVSAARDSIGGPAKIVVSLVAAFVLQWKLCLLSLAVFPFIWLFIEQNKRKMKSAQDRVQLDLSDLTAMMQESLQGTRVIRAFSGEDRVGERFFKLIQTSLASQMKAARRIATLRPTVELIGAVGLALVLYFASYLVKSRELSIADLGTLIFTLDGVNQGLRSLGGLKQTMAQIQSGTERIYSEILDVPDEVGAREGSLPVPLSPKGVVEFHDVNFTYPDGTEALHGVNLRIEPGESVALVGPSGSGKSTIADLLLRFYEPTSGRITFDGADISTFSAAEWRLQIGVVPQQLFLFAGTLAENVRLGNPQATEKECEAAALAAHAMEFVREMPNGLESSIGERGIRLSGGQMQRIALARALVRKPTILLLDEATSALDAESEQAVQAALDEIMKERTTLFIAHRLTTAARAAKILVLSKGLIIESGSHTGLLAQNGVYAAMVRAFGAGSFV